MAQMCKAFPSVPTTVESRLPYGKECDYTRNSKCQMSNYYLYQKGLEMGEGHCIIFFLLPLFSSNT